MIPRSPPKPVPPPVSQYRQRIRDNAVNQIVQGLTTLSAEFRIDKITDEDMISSIESIIRTATQLKTRIKK